MSQLIEDCEHQLADLERQSRGVQKRIEFFKKFQKSLAVEFQEDEPEEVKSKG